MPRDNSKKNYLAIPPKPAVVSFQGPSIGQSIKDGVGLGIGSSIGRHIFDSFFGRLEKPSKHEKCMTERVEFENCLRANNSCEDRQITLQQCLQN
jgi:hypothetical protein